MVEAGPRLGTSYQCVVWPMALGRVWMSVALTLQFPCFSEFWEVRSRSPVAGTVLLDTHGWLAESPLKPLSNS